MSKVFLFGSQVSYDKSEQKAVKGQIIRMNGYEYDEYVVYEVVNQDDDLGGRFNPKLTHEGEKKAGWIFSKSKENELNNLLTFK
jgi:hypothetical protein